MRAMTSTPTHTIIAWSENARPRAHVGDHPADERRDDDGDAAHRRRALLDHVVLGPVILLAEDRLALAAGAEEGDQEPGAEQRHEHGAGAGDHDGDHGSASRSSAATCVSSNGDRSVGVLWVCSWPLPAITTTSPGRAALEGGTRWPIDGRGQITTRARYSAPTPSMMSLMIAVGSSERGLSDVTTTRSASSAAVRPSRGACAGRGRRRIRTPRSPSCRPPPLAPQANTSSRPSGVCA